MDRKSKMIEELKKYLDETPKDVLDQEFFRATCEVEGIDPTLPNAKKLLKKKQRRDMWKYKIWPKIINAAFLIFAVFCAFNAGCNHESGHHWGLTVFHLLGAFGWISAFIQINNREEDNI